MRACLAHRKFTRKSRKRAHEHTRRYYATTFHNRLKIQRWSYILVQLSLFVSWMAHCGYKALPGKVTHSQGTPWGQSADYPGQLEFIALKDCTKGLTGHLKTVNLSADECLGTEIKLLLAKAGKFHPKKYNMFVFLSAILLLLLLSNVSLK